mmetsp:Transcript_33891/g.62435  ORF Transcript_33891/g.62435 Transcript_33891/m.62435 type:complete len:209 (-) Transcript_33891:80-706(-)
MMVTIAHAPLQSSFVHLYSSSSCKVTHTVIDCLQRSTHLHLPMDNLDNINCLGTLFQLECSRQELIVISHAIICRENFKKGCNFRHFQFKLLKTMPNMLIVQHRCKFIWRDFPITVGIRFHEDVTNDARELLLLLHLGNRHLFSIYSSDCHSLLQEQRCNEPHHSKIDANDVGHPKKGVVRAHVHDHLPRKLWPTGCESRLKHGHYSH